MRLLDLTLRGFRSYADFSCDFAPGVNLIVGQNAQGKTNLLEAICYLSRGAAFRTRREAELIRFGAEFADLSARVESFGREQTLRAVMFAGRRPRQLYLSGVRKPSREALDGYILKAYADATNHALLDEYKRLQYQMQLCVASGRRMEEDDLQRMQKIAGLLQFNQDASAYLLAEFRFQKMLADIYKILADVAGIDLDMLSGQ